MLDSRRSVPIAVETPMPHSPSHRTRIVRATGRPEDSVWMERALRLARAAGARGEVPIGAVVTTGDRTIGSGSNRPIAARDPTAHAEIVALRRAARSTGNYRLTGATLYVTLEPCLMCLGAILHARIGRLVYGARDPKVGVVEYMRRHRPVGLNHELRVTGGVRADDSAELLRAFFHRRR